MRHGNYRSCVAPGEPRTLELASCGSTQDELRVLAAAGAADWSWVQAGLQTAGRGRRGRRWIAPAGSALMISVLLRSRRPVAELPGLSLVGGLAVCAATERLGAATMLRWPNDVVCGERKLAGVLPELTGDGAVLLGCGINAGMTEAELPPTDRLAATSLHVETGLDPDLTALRDALLDGLRVRLEVFDRSGLAGLADELAARDALRGRSITLRLADGTSSSGIATGIGPDGALLVDDRPHHAGEVERVG